MSGLSSNLTIRRSVLLRASGGLKPIFEFTSDSYPLLNFTSATIYSYANSNLSSNFADTQWRTGDYFFQVTSKVFYSYKYIIISGAPASDYLGDTVALAQSLAALGSRSQAIIIGSAAGVILIMSLISVFITSHFIAAPLAVILRAIQKAVKFDFSDVRGGKLSLNPSFVVEIHKVQEHFMELLTVFATALQSNKKLANLYWSFPILIPGDVITFFGDRMLTLRQYPSPSLITHFFHRSSFGALRTFSARLYSKQARTPVASSTSKSSPRNTPPSTEPWYHLSPRWDFTRPKPLVRVHPDSRSRPTPLSRFHTNLTYLYSSIFTNLRRITPSIRFLLFIPRQVLSSVRACYSWICSSYHRLTSLPSHVRSLYHIALLRLSSFYRTFTTFPRRLLSWIISTAYTYRTRIVILFLSTYVAYIAGSRVPRMIVETLWGEELRRKWREVDERLGTRISKPPDDRAMTEHNPRDTDAAAFGDTARIIAGK
ncbi:hypothetical protein HDU93_009238 [Gonapodya sp. JEL0774]|nr:hypothetical protein HDU93_009238 [Gonapodya sp. JEL0774]